MPLLGLIAGTGAIGPEIDDGSIVYLLSKPLEPVLDRADQGRWWPSASSRCSASVPVLVAGLVLSGTSDNLAVGYGLGALDRRHRLRHAVPALAVVTRHAVVIGLLYALIWETLVGSWCRARRR